ncbi:hypothetical protein ILUMI_15818 [Ignelater luminosus]|uniref:DDE Tnp4 domain-containing protein n=1 Tax=Ignelater luminosus TaxID=2038154 RepID=A0A8K0G956_IGNLU|nr:hypothetical protein ILUMI_15818 [Ignelater luminosus]
MNFQEVVQFVAIDVLGDIKEAANRPPRRFQRRESAFNLPDHRFVKMFRLTKPLVRELIETLQPFIVPPNRTSALDVETKVLTTLRFYASRDSGYPLRPWLLTPLQEEPAPGSPLERYNRCHKTTRSIIERCNGVLKMRFRHLLRHRVLHYTPTMASKIINACCIFHNMCIAGNLPDPEPEDEDLYLGIFQDRQNRVNPDLGAGRLIQNYFGN